MRLRFFTLVTALVLAFAVAAAFSTAAGARAGVGPRAVHKSGTSAKIFVKPNALTRLYNQNNQDSGVADVSQNFEAAFDVYDSQLADDFKVKSGHVWKVKEVDVTGVYFNGAGPAVSENVTFYKDAGGSPGVVKKTYTGVVGADNGTGSFVIALPGKGTKLTAGHYWVSVQANLDFGVGGEWGWENRLAKKGTAAEWQNPGDGFGSGCTSYATMTTCIPGSGGPDLMFALKGTTT
jgi:hypothetical protein